MAECRHAVVVPIAFASSIKQQRAIGEARGSQGYVKPNSNRNENESPSRIAII